MRQTLLAAFAVLAACAPHPGSALEAPARWRGHSVELLDEAGRPLPTFDHRGRTFVLGTLGQRYAIRFRNGSGRRVEVVAAVDGRDVVDGQPAAFDRRGYVVEPWGELTIDGYRLSEAAVAAFRFSSVPRSYAARKGDARDVGVIGLAVFAERRPPEPRPLAVPPPWRGPASEAPAGSSGAPAARDAAPAQPEAEGGAVASAPPSRAESRAAPRPGLGTEFGEERASPVTQVGFERASSRPGVVLTLRYDDRAGLLAQGVDVDGERWARREEARRREAATPFRSEWCEPPPGWGGR
jgi:hypothetical protein